MSGGSWGKKSRKKVQKKDKKRTFLDLFGVLLEALGLQVDVQEAILAVSWASSYRFWKALGYFFDES